MIIDMKLEKKLRIDDFIKPKTKEGSYQLKLEGFSELTFDKKTLKKYGIKPSINLKGKILSIILNSRKVKKGRETLVDITKNDVLIKNVDKIDRQSRGGIPFRNLSYVHDELIYPAYFETFYEGGGVSHLPIPFYKLNLELDEKEHNQLRNLPASTVMKVDFKLVED